MILLWCKTQITCFLILEYIEMIFIREGNNLNRITKRSNCNRIFDLSLIVANAAIIFDGITACTVNLTDKIPRFWNLAVHFCMYASYEIFVALLFWYWISVTVGIPKGRWVRAVQILPSAVLALITLWLMPGVEFIQGKHTAYSMGAAVYVSFSGVAVFCILTVAFIFIKKNYIPKRMRVILTATVFFIAVIMTLQLLFPETLITSIAVIMIIISIYLNMENPAIHGLEHYHNEMIMGFSTLVENKDDNTGGHIRRSSAYANLIAKNLRNNKKYKNVITKDYLNNLIQAAPMHDIGKIGISDAILQKPGKLTAEEFETMKNHTVIGGRIIEDTFGHLLNTDYEKMAYKVAMYHHEKWNGKGYPEGLSGDNIPLCARIMAVADVFDAVSSKRCYRDAMSLDACYDIISRGRGVDFDPDVVDAFMSDRNNVEEIYSELIDKYSSPKL